MFKDFRECVSAPVKLVYWLDGNFFHINILKVIQGGAQGWKTFANVFQPPSNYSIWFTSLSEIFFNIILKVIQGGAQRLKDFRKRVSASVKLVYWFHENFLYINVLKVIQGGALRSNDFRECASASVKLVY